MVRMATFIPDQLTFLMDWMAQQGPAAPSFLYFSLSLHLHALKRAILLLRMDSKLEMLLTIDSTERLVRKIVAGVSCSRERTFWIFSPSALRMWESAACCKATETIKSVIA